MKQIEFKLIKKAKVLIETYDFRIDKENFIFRLLQITFYISENLKIIVCEKIVIFFKTNYR